MIAEVQTALVIIVFAGGPHTATRYERFRELLPSLRPDAVFLTGADFGADLIADTQGMPVCTDECRTTLTSCFSIAARLRERFPAGARLLVVTSNYHAPRVAWLLRGVLPRRYALSLATCRDMTWHSLRTTRLSQRLFLGEIKSWVYCFPIGLLLRPLPTAILLGIVALRFRRRREPSTDSSRPPNNRPDSTGKAKT